MRAADIFRLSVINAMRGRIRTVLTTTAIAIGVAATILVVAIGSTARTVVSEQLDSIGISGVAIFPKKTATEQGVTLTADDAVAVMAQVDGIDAAMPITAKYGTYNMKNWQGTALIYGVNEQLGDILSLTLLHGRLPNAGDIRQRRMVAVVDDQLANMVYSRSNIVGKMIELSADGVMRQYEVVGVISSQSAGISSLIGDVLPCFVYVPATTFGGSTDLYTAEQLLVTCDDEGAVLQAIEYLNRRHQSAGAFRFEDIGGYRKQIDGAMLTVSLFIAAVGAISMMVAGIGIMNSMLSTAIERRREVGIYMSLGARRRDIMLGFLTEAGIISAAGGFIGVAAGLAVVAIVEAFSGLEISIEPLVAVITEVSAIVCGVLFGMLPAVRASRLDPITALRD